MKKVIMLLLTAVLSVAIVSAQEMRETSYYIDGQIVEKFDGTQLKGKTILNYTIDQETNTHKITTSEIVSQNLENVKVLSSTSKIDGLGGQLNTAEAIIASKKDVAYVIDGKPVSFNDMKSLSSSSIKSVKVVKDKDNPDFKKYSEEYKKKTKIEPKFIILISTK